MLIGNEIKEKLKNHDIRIGYGFNTTEEEIKNFTDFHQLVDISDPESEPSKQFEKIFLVIDYL